MKKLIIIEIVIIILLAIGVGIFDATLDLGQFQGLVFSLYLAYASILLFIINGIISMVYYFKNKKDNAGNFLLAGIIASVIGLAIAYIPNLVLQ